MTPWYKRQEHWYTRSLGIIAVQYLLPDGTVVIHRMFDWPSEVEYDGAPD